MKKSKGKFQKKHLVVMIPCYNEEKTIAAVIKSIPRRIPDIRKIDILIIDDACTDKTVSIAQKYGVKYIVKNGANKGLARTFEKGLRTALEIGADIIVNTDGDNQYPQKDIPKLIDPILHGHVDIVIGDRQTDTIPHFSPIKKILQKLGSWVVRILSQTDVPDAVSGFRAFSRHAAMKINVFTDYTYTIETLIQAGRQKLTITSIPIKTNAKTRNSRLVKNIFSYLKKSSATIFKIIAIYEPLKVFTYLGITIALPGVILIGRFFYYYFLGDGNGHVQSIIVGAIIIVIGFQTVLFGLIASLIAINRKLAEESSYYIKHLILDKKS